MSLVPVDLPNRLAAAGLGVTVLSGWESRGSMADHRAVVLHSTASSRSESPDSCAHYCFVGADNAPLYNVLVDRTGWVWVGAREKSNNAGNISGTALNEVLRGQANLTPAGERGLGDTTSDNASLFGVSVQNDGVGEPWHAVDQTAHTCAVVLSALGLPHAGYLTTHKALTARKVDTSDERAGCPRDWHTPVNAYLHGAGPTRRRTLVGIAKTPSGHGYWQCGPDGGVFAFGDAAFYGSMGGHRLARPVVDMASTPSGNGYALVADDGGVFTFGDCGFEGSMGGQKINAPVCGIEIDADGTGYWLVAEDGGIFAFKAEFHGSAAGHIHAWSP